MGAPTSEVGYTSATIRRGNHEVRMEFWWHWWEKYFDEYNETKSHQSFKIPIYMYRYICGGIGIYIYIYSSATTCPLWTSWSPLPMRCVVIYEYEVPGGALNLSSTKLPRPWSPWESSLQGKILMAESGIEPGTS
jgi:hypothetical protein